MSGYVSEGHIAFTVGVAIGFLGVVVVHWDWLGMLSFLAIYWATVLLGGWWLARRRHKRQEARDAER